MLGLFSLPSLLAALTIGVLLALPATAHLLFAQLAARVPGATVTPELTAFLPPQVDHKTTLAVAERLQKLPGVAKTRLLLREDTLARMKSKGTGALADAIAVLPNNPFPDAIVVTPADDDPATLEALAATVRQWREVEYVQVDIDWARRLAALGRLMKAGGLLLAGMLGLALLTVVSNTLRIAPKPERSDENPSASAANGGRLTWLVRGMLLGLMGGVAAWLIVVGAIFWLRLPVAELAGLYGLDFTLALPGMPEGLALIGATTVLGGCGALLASVGKVSRHG
ncbi:MAG: cell division protein FtsX [Rhodocyclaceae bacterium]